MLLVTLQCAKKKHLHKNMDKDQRNLGIITFELFNLFFAQTFLVAHQV